jgi:hypothetical protein
MRKIVEGQLTFEFPDDWMAEKFDEWTFYREHFQRIPGTKAVDILAIAPNQSLWLIEVKDYRHHPRTKVIDLADEIAVKARDTLAALAAGRLNANDDHEKDISDRAMRSRRINVVLHLEQPEHRSRKKQGINDANLLQRLKQVLKAIDPQPIIVDMKRVNWVKWRTI